MNREPAGDSTGRLPERAGENLQQAERQATAAMQSEVSDHRAQSMPQSRTAERPATDFDGKPCATQPRAGQVPTLEAGRRTDGCSFSDFQTRDAGAQMPPLNTAELYNRSREQTVRLDVGVPSERGDNRLRTEPSSGVIVARDGERCLIATANHSVSSIQGEQIVSRGATFADGSRYPVSVEARDRSRDLAIVAAHTGRDTERVCQPATIAERGEGGARSGPATALGFPERSRTLQASPGVVEREIAATNLRSAKESLPGERANRPLLDMSMHTRPGNSGGPVFNERGAVQGLVYGGPPSGRAHIERTWATPIDRPLIDGMLSRMQPSRQRAAW
jgi:S1-C subfamily serine protease